jgi:hypothetical protein
MKKVGAGLKPAPTRSLARRVVGMKIGKGFKEWYHSIENDPQKRLCFIAFRDFCFDLFEEEFGRIPREEEIAPEFAKGFLIHT